MRRAAYWSGTVAAVSGVTTAALLVVAVPWLEAAEDTPPLPALLDALFYAALTTGAVALVATVVALALGERRMARWGAAGPLAWVLTYAFWYLTVD